ncbi:hypothetical protein TNCV_3583631 [Trichonephila clavipes]|nr:hypothetical protein TNCV_3583631 [Trichonephila clavipes]
MDGQRKVSARQVPCKLTPRHMGQRMTVCLEHVVRYHEDSNDFLFRIVTWDESWVSFLGFEACPGDSHPQS